MTRRRPGAARWATAVVIVVASQRARAQSCHLPPRIERDEDVMLARLRSETASFSNAEYAGHYEGLMPSVSFRREWFEALLSLPVYRIVRNGRSDRGPGDLLLDARAALVRDRQRTRAFGLELTATLPTGDPTHELGMGHVMLLPGLWGAVTEGRFGLSARAGYARAVGGSSAHHHHAGGTSPLVDPMNESELDVAVAGAFSFARLFSVHAGGYGAVPVAVENGRGRAVVFGGGGVQSARFGTTLELHLPLAGEPFTRKLVLELAARF